MSSTRQTLIDSRGYIFLFPSLGLPHPKGEWISLRAGIGAQDEVTPMLQDTNTQPPPRFPTGREASYDIEYEGAVWTLPLLTADTLYASEIFSIRVRRIPLATAPSNPQRFVAPPGMTSICLQPPPKELGVQVVTAPGPEFDAVFAEAKKKGKYDFIHSASAQKKKNKKKSALDSDSDDDAAAQGAGSGEGNREDWGKEIKWSGRAGSTTMIIFDPQWLQTALMDFFKEALRTNTMKQGERLKVKLRARPCAGDDLKDLEYAIRRQGKTRPVEEKEWKLLPYEGAKEGVHLHCLNLARESVGRKGWSKEEWEARVKERGKA